MADPHSTVPVFSLSVHATYACRHAGACCTAGWSIPVEQPVNVLLGTGLLVPGPDGACRFHERGSRLCSIHRQHGHAALPLACRQFPRRAVVDGRGVHVTLSHFCPTAAALLVDATGPLAIVANPPAFPADAIEDALDARGAWPPLVAPRILFDLDAYSRWERFVVGTLADAADPQEALARIATAAERLRRWTPAAGPLDAHVRRSTERPDDDVSDAALARYAAFAGGRGWKLAIAAAPPELRPPVRLRPDAAAAERPAASSGAVRRYLAAKAFASWSAYQARGVRTLVAELVFALDVLEGEAARLSERWRSPADRDLLLEAVRGADWLLMHAADRAALLKTLGTVEAQA